MAPNFTFNNNIFSCFLFWRRILASKVVTMVYHPNHPKKDYTSVFDASFSWKHYSWLQLQACSAPDEHQQHNQKPDQKHTLFKNIYMELLQIVKVQEYHLTAGTPSTSSLLPHPLHVPPPRLVPHHSFLPPQYICPPSNPFLVYMHKSTLVYTYIYKYKYKYIYIYI